jgi:hypothetical protein
MGSVPPGSNDPTQPAQYPYGNYNTTQYGTNNTSPPPPPPNYPYQPTQPPYMYKPPPSKRPTGLYILIGVLVLFVILAISGFVYLFATRPTTTSTTGTNGNSTGQGCFGGKNFQLGSTLSDSNVYYRVEFNTNGTWPEYESWLSPGNYTISSGVGGWVWEFPASCTADQLRADANSTHNRRMSQTQGGSGSVLEPNDPIVTAAFSKQ